MQKKAVVTGGCGGIGEAICRKLSSDGYFVYVNYAHSKDKAEKLASEIGGEAVCFDVSDKNAVKDFFGRVNADLLVNNAGISVIDLFTAVSDEKSQQIMDINLVGTMNCARAALPYMINQKCGNIINITSMWGQCGASCEVDYSASKAGIIGFTKALAKETAPSGIRVNCVAPGFILTEMNKQFSKDELNSILEEIPLGFFGTPKHIADAVCFLASEKSAYITGQVLAVNGGMII